MAPRILLVEDDPTIHRHLREALAAEGYEVADASDGAQALAALAVTAPDLVLLDLGLPDMDGVDLCRVIRRTVPGTTIVVLKSPTESTSKPVASWIPGELFQVSVTKSPAKKPEPVTEIEAPADPFVGDSTSRGAMENGTEAPPVPDTARIVCLPTTACGALKLALKAPSAPATIATGFVISGLVSRSQ